MKPFPILVAVASLCAAVYAVSWLSQPPSIDVPIINEAGMASENPFEMPKSGPYPKAVLEEEQFDFGRMILGATGSHAFLVRNVGDAPLKLHKGQIACKCTVPQITEEEIAPGESTEVVMEWKPLDISEAFDKWADIWTNDPENEKLRLTITGEVRQLVSLHPPPPWTINIVNESGPTQFEGNMVSGVEAFNIIDIESSHDWLSATAEPIVGTELERFGPSNSSGYRVVGKVLPEMSVGRFEGMLTIHTDLKADPSEEGDGYTLEVPIVGTRPGPFSILGQSWYGGDMTVRMGTVKSAEGKTVTLTLFTDREDEPLKIESIKADPNIAQVKLERDEKFPSPVKEKYALSFVLPPKIPVGRYTDDHRISVILTTNRETMSEVNLSIDAIVE